MLWYHLAVEKLRKSPFEELLCEATANSQLAAVSQIKHTTYNMLLASYRGLLVQFCVSTFSYVVGFFHMQIQMSTCGTSQASDMGGHNLFL